MTERPETPGRHIVESAITTRDAGLLRKVARERKGLNNQQRDALLLVADLLDGAMQTPPPGLRRIHSDRELGPEVG